MMNKIFSKTVNKTTLWSVILAIVLAAAIVVCAVFGFNRDATTKDVKTLTVSSNAYEYNQNLDKIQEDCEKLFGKLDVEYTTVGKMSGAVNELVFVFDKDADLTGAQTAVKAYFTQNWKDVIVQVSVSTEVVSVAVAQGYVLRAAIACVVFAVLAFAYVSLRYNLSAGIATAVSTLLGMLMTAAVIVLVRVPVTASVAYVVAVAGLLTAAMTLFTMNKIRANAKAEGTEEEKVVASVAWQEVLSVAAVLAVALILVAIMGKTAGLRFALSGIVGVAVATLLSLVYAPAVYLCLKTAADKKPARDAYVGAKKTSSKIKKIFTPAAKAEEAAETVEEPTAENVEEELTEEATVEAVEEASEAETVEETEAADVAEETTEETSEEAAEEVAEAETPVDEAETVAEETAEEETDEKTEA